MTNLANPASNAAANADAYIASLFSALGSREPFEVLRQTPAALRKGIEGLSRDQLTTPEAPGKWSTLDVVQHLADSELVGGFRFRMTLAHERPPLAGYDQDLWAKMLRYRDVDLETALEQFAALRKANLGLLQSATPAERERVGLHSERGEESITKMIRMYAGHDLVHLRQLNRIRTGLGL
jgi:DinB superfamily